ncbi:MAG: dTDP-4-dehydrorhamnose reductase [Chthonomonadales bacterium]
MRNRYHRVLVTGAAGMFGLELCIALEANGNDLIRGVHTMPRNAGSTYITLDITDPNSISQALDSCHPDLVINCAAYTMVDMAESEPELAMLINGIGPGFLAEACQRRKIALASISTDYVFDGDKGSGYVVTDTPNALGAYAASKLAGEVSVRQYTEFFWIIRTSWLYGIHGRCFPQIILNAAMEGRQLRVVADQIGCPTYTIDLADAIIRIVQTAPFGIYHAAGAGSTSWYNFARKTLELAGIDYPVARITTIEWPTPARRPPNSTLLSQAMQKAGLAPIRPWEEGLADYIKELRATRT